MVTGFDLCFFVGFTGLCIDFHQCNEFLSGFTGFYLVLLRITGFSRFNWVLLCDTGFSWFDWIFMGSTGFYWVFL